MYALSCRYSFRRYFINTIFFCRSIATDLNPFNLDTKHLGFIFIDHFIPFEKQIISELNERQVNLNNPY